MFIQYADFIELDSYPDPLTSSVPEDVQDELLDILIDHYLPFSENEEDHGNSVRDQIRSRMNRPIREPFEYRPFYWVDYEEATLH
jgi:hypothetical protein